MSKTKIRNYQIFSIIFTFILGSLLHFTYDLSGRNTIVGLFSSVNESTWEHLKLIFFPMLIVLVIGFFCLKQKPNNYLCAKTFGILTAMIFTVIFFYTYTGVLGRNFAIIDISTFFTLFKIMWKDIVNGQDYSQWRKQMFIYWKNVVLYATNLQKWKPFYMQHPCFRSI